MPPKIYYFEQGSEPLAVTQARFYLAMSRLHVLDTKLRGADPFDRILGPGQRGELLQELTQGLQAMAKGFGPEHMLVRKAKQLERSFL